MIFAKVKKEKRLVRCVAIPMASPVGNSELFWKRLRVGWNESTCLANWCMTELVKADVTVTASMKKLPPMPYTYLYGIFNKKYPNRTLWDKATSSAGCVINAVQKKWKDCRESVLWERSQSLPVFKYAYPYRVHNKDWSIKFIGDKIAVSLVLPGGRMVAFLRGGPEYRRQINSLKNIGNGDVKPGELIVCWDKKNKQAVFRFSLSYPKTAPSEIMDQVLLCSTDSAAFWVAEIQGRGKPWIINADQMKRWSDNHCVFLQRLREDLKYEKNATRKQRRHMLEHAKDRCRKFKDRRDSFCHEVTAQLVGFAVRQKVREVLYKDDNRSYLPKFSWHLLKQKLGYKLEAAGIVLMTDKPSKPESHP